jgi:phosphatidate cytidylyltransferase
MAVNSSLGSRLKIALPVTGALTASIFYSPAITSWFVVMLLIRSLWEFYHIFKTEQSARSSLSLVFAFVYLYCSVNGYSSALAPLGLLGLFLLFASQLFFPSEKHGTAELSLTLMGFVFVIVLGEHALRIYQIDGPILGTDWGPRLFFAALFTCKFSDATAYFCGCRWGKHKMMPTISPKKSWEGLGGAYAGGLVCLPLFMNLPGFSLWYSLAICLLIVSTATVGDLFESQFKRELNVKDTADDIPGFGGTLDMLDSVLWVMPMVYWYTIIYGIHSSQT